MDGFFDLHCHILPGVDDGAPDEATALAMLSMAYRDGIRSVCFTPHRNPYIGMLGGENVRETFSYFCPVAKKHFPDMRFSLGSEIMYYDGCTDDIRDEKCFSMGGGKYLLLEFPPEIEYSDMKRALGRVTSYGYRVLLAHAERYGCLLRKPGRIEELSEEDVLIQLNASLFRKFGFWEGRAQRRFVRTVFSSRIPFLVATDAHNTDSRPPHIFEAYHKIREKLGDAAAREVFWSIPSAICRSFEWN